MIAHWPASLVNLILDYSYDDMSESWTLKIHGYGKQGPLLQAINVARFVPGTTEDKLNWLQSKGFELGRSTYFSTIKFIKEDSQNRLNYIAKTEFADEFLQQIDRAKQNISDLTATMRDARTPPMAKAKMALAVLEWEKHLTKLYDADNVVTHMMDKINNKDLEQPSNA